MKTEALIERLSREPRGAGGGSLGGGVTLAAAGGALAALLLFGLVLGVRPGLGGALSDPVTAAKTLIPLAAGLLALALALTAARPGARAGAAGLALVAVALSVPALAGWALAETPPGQRLARFLGHSIGLCLPAIVVLSAPIAAALFAALRRGAPEHPARCGALAGLASAGLATALYSLSCTEDSPLFYLAWYGLGMLIVTALGALAGARVLRW